MTVTGVVNSVGPQWQGSSLAADVVASAVVLPVTNAGAFEDFTEGPPPQSRFLTIGEDLAPREYIDSQQDDDYPQTLTLAEPLGVGFETGLPVYLWDPASTAPDKRAVQFRALVVLDDQPDGDPIRASIDMEKVPVAEAYALEGTRVSLVQDEDDGEWWVDRIRGRSPRIDSSYLDVTYATAVLPADIPWPDVTWTRVTTWQLLESNYIDYDPATGIFWVTQDGIYTATFGVSFNANPTRARGARPVLHLLDGSTDIRREVNLPANESGYTSIEVSLRPQRLLAGEGISFEAAQNSGASLSLRAARDVRLGLTEVGITRQSP